MRAGEVVQKSSETKALLRRLFPCRGAECHLLGLLEDYPLAIFAVYQRRLVFANRPFFELFGYRPEEVLDQSTKLFFEDEEEWEEMGRKLYAALDRGVRRALVVWNFRRADGSFLKGRVLVAPVAKISGSWLVLCALDDVTGEFDYLKQVEEKHPFRTDEHIWQNLRLKKQKDFLVQLVESLPVGVVIHDGTRVIYQNRLVSHYFPKGLPAELVGFLEEGRAEEKEIALPEGRIFLAQVVDLEPAYRLLIVKDVTFLTRLKENLDRYVEARLEEKLARERLVFMGKLLAEVAHEINTPLSFMKTNLQVFRAYVETLEKILSSGCREEDLPKLEKIIRESAEIARSLELGTERIAHLVQSVKSLSRQKEEPHVVDVGEALLEALSLTYNRTKRVLRIVVNGHVYEPHLFRLKRRFLIRGTKASLVQMFVILVNNAAEAARERKVRGAKLEIVLRDTGKQVEVTFVDNCGGVEEEKLERLFEQFYTTKAEGSGLGLYILKELATLLNAKLLPRNNPEVGGFEVTLSFPKELPAEEAFKSRWEEMKDGH